MARRSAGASPCARPAGRPTAIRPDGSWPRAHLRAPRRRHDVVPRRRAVRPAAPDPRAGRRARTAVPVHPAGQRGLAASIADRTLDYPQQAQLSGRATGADGGPLAAAPIAVQIATAGRFVTLARATTNPDGSWSAPLRTQYSRSLRAVATLPEGTQVSSPRDAGPGRPAPARARAQARDGAAAVHDQRQHAATAREGRARDRPAGVRRAACTPSRALKVKARRGRFRTRIRLQRAGADAPARALPADSHNRCRAHRRRLPARRAPRR